MANEYLAIYLNDHLAGSVIAIDLLDYLEPVYAGSDMARFFATLREEIISDRLELERLMQRLQIVESRPRKASAWIAGKFTELKLRVDDNARGPFRLLESLEAIGLGIHGKWALWRALGAAASANTELQGILDYQRLEERAQEQREAVELLRLEAAKAAFKEGHRGE